MRRQRGLSIIELIILLVLIMVLAAAVIPKILDSRVTAGETSAIVYMSMINQAQRSYIQMYPQVGYATRLSDLGTPKNGICAGGPTPTQACLIHYGLAHANIKDESGYMVELLPGPVPQRSYFAVAVPARYGVTGRLTFCSEQNQVVHQRDLSRGRFEGVTPEACATFPALP